MIATAWDRPAQRCGALRLAAAVDFNVKMWRTLLCPSLHVLEPQSPSAEAGCVQSCRWLLRDKRGAFICLSLSFSLRRFRQCCSLSGVPVDSIAGGVK